MEINRECLKIKVTADLRRGVDGEFELGFLSVVHRETLHEQRREARSSSASKRVEDKETLESSALIGQFSNSIQNQINDFFSDCVVSTGIVVGRVFLSRDQLFRMVKLSVVSTSDLICNSGAAFEISSLSLCLSPVVEEASCLNYSVEN